MAVRAFCSVPSALRNLNTTTHGDSAIWLGTEMFSSLPPGIARSPVGWHSWVCGSQAGDGLRRIVVPAAKKVTSGGGGAEQPASTTAASEAMTSRRTSERLRGLGPADGGDP